MNFTKAQKEAIEAEGNVLVLAGAGTGKTRTMVEHCCNRLLRPDKPTTLDRILMVTFTVNAAAEMKERIAKRLNERLERLNKCSDNSKTRQQVNEQLALLDTAKIGTLHSVEFKLIREHYLELRLSPKLRVLSPEECHPLEEAALREAFDKHYQGNSSVSESVRRLIKQVGREQELPGRDLVRRLHHYAQSLRSPREWLQQQHKLYEEQKPVQWIRWLWKALSDRETSLGWIEEWEDALQENAAECPNLQECLHQLDKLRRVLLQNAPENLTVTEAASALAPHFERIIDADQEWIWGTKKRCREPIEKFFKDSKFLYSLLRDEHSSSPLAEDWELCREWVLALLQLTKDFQTRFVELKTQQGVLDFHDLDQQLLGTPDKGLTQTAREMREMFDYVFVDEYQDINDAQDAIIRALSREGQQRNLFIVGDVKQCIYRFRRGKPEILKGYASEWKDCPGHTIVHLQDNFRSDHALLQFINGFCKHLAGQVPGFDYTANDQLNLGRNTDGAADDAKVELHLVKPSLSPIGTPREEEIHIIAKRIQALLKTKIRDPDSETEEPRLVEYKDIAILLRSVRTSSRFSQGSTTRSMSRFLRVFKQLYGIPIQAEAEGFFELPEIKDLFALLKILDNPLQDIPLLAVLRSPFFDFTPDELAAIRLAQRQGKLWSAIHRFCQKQEDDSPELKKLRTVAEGKKLIDDARRKCGRFLESHKDWSLAGRTKPPSERLEFILTQTYYVERLASLAPHRNPQAHINRFIRLARKFESQQPAVSLPHFLQWIDGLRESEHEIEILHAEEPESDELRESEPLNPLKQSAADAVRLMTIHKSKGLEFPIVIVATLNKRINFTGSRDLLDEEYGLGPTLHKPDTDESYPSLPHWLCQRKERAARIVEEACLFYVASTRARERLILSGTVSEEQINEWCEWAAKPTRPRLKASSYLNWLGPWIATQTKLRDYLETGRQQGFENGIHWTIYG
ncbi:MAG: ATP-dependent helicase/nuclease subunit A [Verrucomicrobia subdivision 3 bacterium]|nr:ATP-dependent helicase/nuclease subunit A [Limisphaerales bacterium]MCS1416386.1 ATP-dependent helicase/nuclease subunit A [Limisphaerales bacterium]